MIQLIQKKYPRAISVGTFRLTLNMEPHELAFLVLKKHGQCYFTRDGNPPTGKRNSLTRLYALSGRAAPLRFTSLAVRTHERAASDADILENYGSVTIEIDVRSVANDLVVFNGDAQDLAHDVSMHYLLDHTLSPEDFAAQLTVLTQNQITGLRPRLYGLYYEARLMRALVPRDIATIYTVDPRALRMAQRLCTIVQ